MKRISKLIWRVIKLFFNIFLCGFGLILFILSLSYLKEYDINYVEIEATIIEYKNMSDNTTLDNHKSLSLKGEFLLLRYTYNDKQYEITYEPLISDDFNNFKTGDKTMIKINPSNPKEIIWNSDKTVYIFLFLGIFVLIISIINIYKNILVIKKTKTEEDEE